MNNSGLFKRQPAFAQAYRLQMLLQSFPLLLRPVMMTVFEQRFWFALAVGSCALSMSSPARAERVGELWEIVGDWANTTNGDNFAIDSKGRASWQGGYLSVHVYQDGASNVQLSGKGFRCSYDVTTTANNQSVWKRLLASDDELCPRGGLFIQSGKGAGKDY